MRGARGRGVRRWWPELTFAVLWLAACAALSVTSLSHDVIWQLWIARQMLGGTDLYTGIIEVNPPLWFWMALPVEWLARATDIPAPRMMVAAMMAFAGLGLALAATLLAHETPRRRAAILFALVLAFLVLLPLPDFAQREHICLFGPMCYVLLAAQCADGRIVSLWQALAVGLLAAAGFALKHYFVVVPVVL